MIVDLFAGPGGWDLAAEALGLRPVGIEVDPVACQTRHNAGLLTVNASVADLPVEPFAGLLTGLIASPPCPTFSQAADGSGTGELDRLLAFADHWAAAGWHDPAEWHDWDDPRTPLVLEPLRWLAADPDWLALEQVPAVAPLWDRIAALLTAAGWRSAWAGTLNAADYGVPQTRRRAFLIASRHHRVEPPAATHAEHPTPTLFGDALAPWVPMATALGWDDPPPADPGLATDPANRGAWVDATPTADDPNLRAWAKTRPATTIVGSFRPDIVAPPTHRTAGSPPRQHTPGAVKITQSEALALQAFPRDYPVAGSTSARWLQIGNAVPPLLAFRVLKAVNPEALADPSATLDPLLDGEPLYGPRSGNPITT